MTLKIKVKVKSFQTRPRSLCDQYMVKFEGKIQNDSKVIVFTRNHSHNDEDRTKNNKSPPPPVRGET